MILKNKKFKGCGYAECNRIVPLIIIIFFIFIQLSSKPPELNPLPILFHLLLCCTALIYSTVLPACDYDQEVTMDYEIHNALDIL